MALFIVRQVEPVVGVQWVEETGSGRVALFSTNAAPVSGYCSEADFTTSTLTVLKSFDFFGQPFSGSLSFEVTLSKRIYSSHRGAKSRHLNRGN